MSVNEDQPIKPSDDLLKLYSISPIHSIIFDKEATQFEEEEAPEGCYYEARMKFIGVKGEMGGTESMFNNWLKFHPSTIGLWQLKTELECKCIKWVRYVEKNKADYNTFLRLKSKFGE